MRCARCTFQSAPGRARHLRTRLGCATLAMPIGTWNRRLWNSSARNARQPSSSCAWPTGVFFGTSSSAGRCGSPQSHLPTTTWCEADASMKTSSASAIRNSFPPTNGTRLHNLRNDGIRIGIECSKASLTSLVDLIGLSDGDLIAALGFGSVQGFVRCMQQSFTRGTMFGIDRRSQRDGWRVEIFLAVRHAQALDSFLQLLGAPNGNIQ